MKNTPDSYMIKPAEVTCIGYKKVLVVDVMRCIYSVAILKVRITKGTLVGGYPYKIGSSHRKLRAENLFVLGIFDLKGEPLKRSKNTKIFPLTSVIGVHLNEETIK